MNTQKNNPWLPLIGFIVLFVALLLVYFLVTSPINFNNILSAFATFVVGVVALYTYIQQKIDKKKDVANLILQEIKHAQDKIENYLQDGNYGLYEKLLLTNSWIDNIHLFVNDFDDTQLELISTFYSRCAYIDVVVAKISDHKHSSKIAEIIKHDYNPATTPIQTIPPTQFNSSPSLSIKQQVSETVEGHPMTQKILSDVSKGIQLIYNTPIGEKFKKIASKDI